MKRILFLMLAMLLVIPLISSLDNNIIDDNFKVNNLIDYKKPCYNNGTYCSNTAVCNYTIFYPNNSILLNNQKATNQKSFHNISFTLTEIGIYTVNQVCYDNAYGSETYYIMSSSTGESIGLGNIILVIAFLTISVIIFFIGNTFKPEQFLLRTSFYLFSILFGILAINSARIIASESLGLSTMSSIGLILGIVIFLFMLLLIFIYWTIQTFKQVKEKQGVRWNY
jgi:hypothetical protein